MEKHIQDKLFDVVEHIPTSKLNPRELKQELGRYFEECIEKGMSEKEAIKAGQQKLKKFMEKQNGSNF